MLTYAVRRLGQLIPVLLGVSAVVFFTVRMIPGDPAQVILGENATPAQIAELRAEMGLDEPVIAQYWLFLVRALRGDLGESTVTGRPVVAELAARLPATLELTLAALAIAVVVGIALGVLAASRPRSLLDKAASVLAVAGVSMPIFWLAMLLMVVLGVNLHLLPFPGRLPAAESLPAVTGLNLVDSVLAGDWAMLRTSLAHLVMPALALATIPCGVIMRMTRSSMRETLAEDFIRTARAKGLHPLVTTFRHGLRNSMLPVLTVIGLQLGLLLGGAVITETIFSWPGIGQIAYQAVYQRDYALIQGVVLYGSLLFVLVNLAVDLLYAILDPRVRY
ncbi:ABC transporter permease [Saccharopolyspora indica]|uniref:ABC transporter permease n=1 Tax=Saccharopolyspora indica TaxID=1229659 RepID=UPI0022EA2B1D|nr:ABC transporter permease [Saccharopolyspora indica]MDA3644054.1 ABC transporter permease [Saccharopolyspora indica]